MVWLNQCKNDIGSELSFLEFEKKLKIILWHFQVHRTHVCCEQASQPKHSITTTTTTTTSPNLNYNNNWLFLVSVIEQEILKTISEWKLTLLHISTAGQTRKNWLITLLGKQLFRFLRKIKACFQEVDVFHIASFKLSVKYFWRSSSMRSIYFL